MKTWLFLFQLFIGTAVFAQTSQLDQLKEELRNKESDLELLKSRIDSLKLLRIVEDLTAIGWPSSDPVVTHSALALAYSEEHEQAKWVSHMILPDIVEARVSRTNDFRVDPLIDSGSAEEKDYFLKSKDEDGNYVYDGFGYDRGHLAPSADFRWNVKALSESYYYSNMSPQRPEFNRGGWADLEGLLRGYIFRNQTPLYVVTGPILNANLEKVTRSVNQVSIPKYYFKVVLDVANERGIGFLMPNEEILNPIETYAFSIDEIESRTGFDFFPNLSEEIDKKAEASDDYSPWLSESEKDDQLPLNPTKIGRNHFNTVQAKYHVKSGRDVNVCGTVVSASKSAKGNIFLNLDKKFPNQIFSITIWKKNLVNFSFDPQNELNHKVICVKGQVRSFEGVPSLSLENEKRLEIKPDSFGR